MSENQHTPEPWVIKPHPYIVVRVVAVDGNDRIFADFKNGELGELAATCVNALRGKNPAALGDVVEAAKDARSAFLSLEDNDHEWGKADYWAVANRITAALAAFERTNP